jgi:hypothetical protein
MMALQWFGLSWPQMLGVGILEKTKIRLFAASASVWREPSYAAGEQQLEEGDEEEGKFHDFRSKHSSGYNTHQKQNLRR